MNAKKWGLSVLTLLVAFSIGLGVYYHQHATSNASQVKQQTTVTISYQTKRIKQTEEVTYRGAKTLLTLLKQEPFSVQTTKDGFITAVAGIKQNTKRGQYWVYTVNNKQTSTSAAKLQLKAHDTVKLKLISYQAKQ